MFENKINQMHNNVRLSDIKNKKCNLKYYIAFKNNLPVARIKKIMKTNNDVRVNIEFI